MQTCTRVFVNMLVLLIACEQIIFLNDFTYIEYSRFHVVFFKIFYGMTRVDIQHWRRRCLMLNKMWNAFIYSICKLNTKGLSFINLMNVLVFYIWCRCHVVVCSNAEFLMWKQDLWQFLEVKVKWSPTDIVVVNSSLPLTSLITENILARWNRNSALHP